MQVQITLVVVTAAVCVQNPVLKHRLMPFVLRKSMLEEVMQLRLIEDHGLIMQHRLTVQMSMSRSFYH